MIVTKHTILKGGPSGDPARYHAKCVPGGVSVALALLEVWDKPWSPNAARFAYHALMRAWHHELDVLEYPVTKSWSDAMP